MIKIENPDSIFPMSINKALNPLRPSERHLPASPEKSATDNFTRCKLGKRLRVCHARKIGNIGHFDFLLGTLARTLRILLHSPTTAVFYFRKDLSSQ